MADGISVGRRCGWKDRGKRSAFNSNGTRVVVSMGIGIMSPSLKRNSEQELVGFGGVLLAKTTEQVDQSLSKHNCFVLFAPVHRSALLFAALAWVDGSPVQHCMA